MKPFNSRTTQNRSTFKIWIHKNAGEYQRINFLSWNFLSQENKKKKKLGNSVKSIQILWLVEICSLNIVKTWSQWNFFPLYTTSKHLCLFRVLPCFVFVPLLRFYSHWFTFVQLNFFRTSFGCSYCSPENVTVRFLVVLENQRTFIYVCHTLIQYDSFGRSTENTVYFYLMLFLLVNIKEYKSFFRSFVFCAFTAMCYTREKERKIPMML